MRLCSFHGLRKKDQLGHLYSGSTHMRKPPRLNETPSMASYYAFLIFLDADITTAEGNPQMPILPSSPALLEVKKDDREDDRNFGQVGREELDQRLDKVVQDLTLTELTPRTQVPKYECNIGIGPTANVFNV